MTFPNATKGVKKLFTAEILKLISVICLAAGLISAVLAFVSAANKSEAGAGATAVAYDYQYARIKHTDNHRRYNHAGRSGTGGA